MKPVDQLLQHPKLPESTPAMLFVLTTAVDPTTSLLQMSLETSDQTNISHLGTRKIISKRAFKRGYVGSQECIKKKHIHNSTKNNIYLKPHMIFW